MATLSAWGRRRRSSAPFASTCSAARRSSTPSSSTSSSHSMTTAWTPRTKVRGHRSGVIRDALHGRRDRGLSITSVRFESPEDPERTIAMTGRPFTIRVGYHAERRFDDVLPGYTVYDHEGRFLFGANTKWFPAPSAVDAGDGEFVFELESVPLLDGDYPVTIGLLTEDEGTVYDWREQEYLLSVMSPGKFTGLLLVPTKIETRQSSGDPLLIARTGT